MVSKILSYERREVGLDGEIVLVADDADSAGNFAADAAALTNHVLAGRERRGTRPRPVGRDGDSTGDSGRDSMRAPLIVSYLGHGGIHLWADENLFDTAAVEQLMVQPEAATGADHELFERILPLSVLRCSQRGTRQSGRQRSHRGVFTERSQLAHSSASVPGGASRRASPRGTRAVG